MSNPKSSSSRSKAPDSVLDLSLRRIHERLRNPAELLKLHLKHYHMTTEQFKFRTSQLQLPRDIIELYDKTVKSCIVCEKSKPVPQRSRVSGMRNEVFGDMIFLITETLKLEVRCASSC